MKIYYYVHTGHRIGLDRFRRAAAIIGALGDDADITLLCSDFRIAHEARSFGIEKSVGIDVIRNIANISQKGDKIIFDSDEANPIMLEDMRNFFSTFIRITNNENDSKAENEFLISPYLKGDGICYSYIVDEKYFEKVEKEIRISYFFGDDDYEKDLEKHLSFVDGLNPDLQLGFYYFLDYEDMLKKRFENYHEFEEYDEMIKKTEILITASPQAVLENLASGGKPIYVQREDYSHEYQTLFKSLNIPIINNYNKDELDLIIKTIDNNNHIKIEQYSNTISKFLKEKLSL